MNADQRFPGGSDGKESARNAGDLGSIPGLGRSPEEENGFPLQFSGLENSMDYFIWSQRVRHDWAAFTFIFTKRWVKTCQFSSCGMVRTTSNGPVHRGWRALWYKVLSRTPSMSVKSAGFVWWGFGREWSACSLTRALIRLRVGRYSPSKGLAVGNWPKRKGHPYMGSEGLRKDRAHGVTLMQPKAMGRNYPNTPTLAPILLVCQPLWLFN